jgi:hypothetical protein
MFLSCSAFAQSGDEEYLTGKLDECLTLSSTGRDRLIFAGWMAASLASAPQLKGIAEVNVVERDRLNRDLARIFTRLITVDCLEESRLLFRAGKSDAFKVAGRGLGRMAMQELMSDRDASVQMERFADYINEADFEKLKVP